MVGDAGVERRRRDGVDDGGVVRLLLVALAVRVDQQRDQAAQDGAAEAHGDHVEQVEVCSGRGEESGFPLSSPPRPPRARQFGRTQDTITVGAASQFRFGRQKKRKKKFHASLRDLLP